MSKRHRYLFAASFIIAALSLSAGLGVQCARKVTTGIYRNGAQPVPEPSVLTVLFSGLGLVTTVRRFRQ